MNEPGSGEFKPTPLTPSSRIKPVRTSKHFQPEVLSNIEAMKAMGIKAPEEVFNTLARHDQAQNVVGKRRVAEITREKEKRQKAEANSYKDPLTGLPNRRAFDEQIERAVAHANRTGTSMVLLAMDVDHFKAVNDSYGHPAGDEVIKTMAHLPARIDEPVYRVGGEEFYQIVTNGITLGDIERAMRRYMESVKTNTKKVLENAQTVEKADPSIAPSLVSMSIGAAIYIPGESKEDFIKRADAELYRAKQNGRGQGYIIVIEQGRPMHILIKAEE